MGVFLVLLIIVVIVSILIGAIRAAKDVTKSTIHYARNPSDGGVPARVVAVKHGFTEIVTFEIAGGERIPLGIPDKLKNTFVVGDTGRLRYHSMVFHDFYRDAS